MATAIPDLWPDLEQSQIVPPVAILREQAAALGKKTNYLLTGRVDTRILLDGGFRHTFHVVAPTLDDYSFDLFWIEHGAGQYPVMAPPLPMGNIARAPIDENLASENELLEYVREVLNSETTKRVVSSLLAQVKATT